MSTLVLLTLTGLGLGALYFLVASGLSLIFGLMDVLNFAHGALVTAGAYAAWRPDRPPALALGRRGGRGRVRRRRSRPLIEPVLIRPLYSRPKDQILVTVGLGLALPALRPGHLGRRRPPAHRAQAARRDRQPPRREGPHRPLRADRRRDRGARARSAVPGQDPVRPDRPRRRRGPGDGHRARHRRAQGVHPGLRDRRGARRAGRGARRRLLRQRLARSGHLAAGLRVHRRGDRRDGRTDGVALRRGGASG